MAFKRPYVIHLCDWEGFHAVQQSGLMNMMEHPLIHLFMPEGAYEAALDHFGHEGNTDPLVIE